MRSPYTISHKSKFYINVSIRCGTNIPTTVCNKIVKPVQKSSTLNFVSKCNFKGILLHGSCMTRLTRLAPSRKSLTRASLEAI